jgi:Lrp/AsnC family transcriptional regulator
MDMMAPLSPADLKLLGLLQRDASLTTVELAEAAGMSQSVCWRRLQRLREDGLILRQVALLDRHKVGFETLIFAQVRLSAHGRANLAGFSSAIQMFPEVLECHVLMGNYDFLLKIIAPDIQAYERFFFDRLSPLDGVQEVNSMVALSEIKMTTELPLSLRPNVSS